MADLVIRIGAESKQFQDELDKISSQTEALNNQLTSLATISGVVFAGLIAEAGVAIHAFGEAEKASNSLAQSLQNQGIYSDDLIDSYKRQADEIQKLTGIDNDSIIKGQAKLQSLIGQTEITDELSKAMADLSTQTGSVESAAEILGRGIEGNTRGLKQFNITVDDNLTREERQAQILEQVTQKFGDQAAAANQGVGSVKGLTAAFDDVQKAIGERLAPVFTRIVAVLTEFFQRIADNKPLLDLIVEVGTFAAAAAGLTTALLSGAIAFVKIREVVMATSEALGIMRVGVSALVGATGIGLLALLVTDLALNWNTRWPQMQAIFAAFVNNISEVASGLGKILLGVFMPGPGTLSQIKEGLNQVKEAFSRGFTEVAEADAANKAKLEDQEEKHQQKQSSIKRAAALKQAEEKRADEEVERAAFQAHLDEMELTQEKAADGIVAAKKEEQAVLAELAKTHNADEIDILMTHLEEIQNINNIQDQQERLRAIQKRDEQKAANQQFLKDQAQFGTAYAEINRIMHSTEANQTKQAFTDLAEMQNSKSATLKSIGKAAAVANIIIKTAESAMNIYAGFSWIPIVGPALGIAGAAAAIAFGAEQIGTVTAAADGGIMSGGIPGRDSIPTLTMPGELVVPTKNFNEVVNSVAAQRNQQVGNDTTQAGGMNLQIGLDGREAEQVLTVRQNEAKALGTYRGSS